MSKTNRQLLDFAVYALEAGDYSLAVKNIEQALQSNPRDAEALFLLGECHQLIGDIEQALDSYRLSILSDPTKSEAWTALGLAHLNKLEPEESRRALNRALREDPGNPEAWMGRCLLRERRGDFVGADRDYARACRLDSALYQSSVDLTDEDLEAAVDDVIADLEPTFQEFMRQVDILVDEIPSDEVLENYNYRVSPGQILAYFAYAEQEESSQWTHLPVSLVLYRRNIQRFSPDQAELLAELQGIIYHEVGGFFGLTSDTDS